MHFSPRKQGNAPKLLSHPCIFNIPKGGLLFLLCIPTFHCPPLTQKKGLPPTHTNPTPDSSRRRLSTFSSAPHPPPSAATERALTFPFVSAYLLPLKGSKKGEGRPKLYRKFTEGKQGENWE